MEIILWQIRNLESFGKILGLASNIEWPGPRSNHRLLRLHKGFKIFACLYLGKPVAIDPQSCFLGVLEMVGERAKLASKMHALLSDRGEWAVEKILRSLKEYGTHCIHRCLAREAQAVPCLRQAVHGLSPEP